MFTRIRRPLSLPFIRTRGDWVVFAGWCLIVLVGTCRADDSVTSADQGNGKQAPTELSVAPLAFPSYPADRPHWIDQAPELGGAVHRWPVVSVPSLSPERCRENLREQTEIAIAAYASHLCDQDPRGDVVTRFHIRNAWVQAVLENAERRYLGTVETSDGEMHEEAALLRFDEAFQEVLHNEWRNQQVRRRLTGLGLLGGGSMALLVGFSVVLRRAGSRKT